MSRIPPKISIEGDYERGQRYIPRAAALARKLARRTDSLGHPSGHDFVRFDDHAYAYAVAVPGLVSVRIVVDSPGGESLELTRKQKLTMPDFLSGCIKSAGIVERERTINGETQVYEALSSFDATGQCEIVHTELPRGEHESERLAVRPYAPMLEDYYEDTPPLIVNSQYSVVSAGLYSGTMRKVVQLLLGFGRQRTYEGEELSVYTDRDEMPKVAVTEALDSAYEKAVRKDGLQLRYDFRFYRTHGIGIGPDGKHWLVEINPTRGVLAMPLPMHPFSTTPEFKDIAAEIGDRDMQDALDEFGGLPTGEAIPSSSTALSAWVRAGRVVRVLRTGDLQPFYEHTPYSTSMGWAFNRRGTEAHNTGWRMGNDGYQRGVHDVISLQYSTLDEVTPRDDAVSLRQAFAEEMKADPRFEAVSWKLDRLNDEQMGHVRDQLSLGVKEAFDAADAYELAPLGRVTGTRSRASEGYLWAVSKEGPKIKFAEPLLGYCVSHSMKPFPSMKLLPPGVICDTTMHVFFVEDELKWVKYFFDGRQVTENQVVDGNEECMYIGSWTSTTDTAPLALVCNFYSNDFDDRSIVGAASSKTVTTGADMGFLHVGCGNDPQNPSIGSCGRSKTFLMTTQTTNRIGYDAITGSAVLVPMGDRESYYYARYFSGASFSESLSMSYKGLGDPWGCSTWRNFPGWTGFMPGGCFGTPNFPACWTLVDHPDGCGPVIANTAVTPSPIYSPGPCSDFADEGPWCSPCDNMDNKVYHQDPPPLPASVSSTYTTESYRETFLVSNHNESPLRASKEARTADQGFGRWYIDSPDEFGNVDRMDAILNCWGDLDAIRFDTAISDGEVLYRNLPGSWQQPKFTLIGVINNG